MSRQLELGLACVHRSLPRKILARRVEDDTFPSDVLDQCAALSVTLAVLVVPAYVADTVALVFVRTATVLTVNVAVAEPAAMSTSGGTLR